ncbi:MAG TPA: rhodanese-like domain-containing protein [Steroidobacteraceae bacterium]|jgi:membrane protein DedA with SNARE-associated domain/rhodanese-related sulfurtransferase|nr:rhodanese-like domain-containing protein [Steroidobacteraceae bacterium]
MEALLRFIEIYGLWVVFVCVLLDQGGLPTPAYPPIVVTTALAFERGGSIAKILFVAILAAVVADVLWYLCGRRFGAAMIRLMCKISLSPDSCVGATRKVYGRWGAKSLIFAKYVPGLAAVATTLAGESRINVVRFIIYDGIGATLWAAGAVALGAIFHDAVGDVLLALEQLGSYALLLFALSLVLFIAIKWRNRRRFLMQLQMARLTPDELEALMRQQIALTILDVRAAERRARIGWIPGSISAMDIETLQLDALSEIVVYCDCPNDVSAAVAARRLKEKGYAKARPLAGGFDAWKLGGRTVILDELPGE